MLITKRRVLALAGMAGLIAAGGSTAAFAGDFSGSRTPSQVNRHTHRSSRADAMKASSDQVAAQLQSSYAALGRARISEDVLPSNVLLGLAPTQQEVGWDPGQSRLVLATQAMSVWLVPGNGVLCTVANFDVGDAAAGSVSFACAFPAVAKTSGVLLIHDGNSVAGVVPQGITTIALTGQDGSLADLTPNADGGIGSSGDQTLSSVSYTGVDGAQHNIAVRPTPAYPPGPLASG